MPDDEVTKLLRDMRATQYRYEAAWRENWTEELQAADEFVELFDQLAAKLGWPGPTT